jgi:hypothetical protein
MSEKPYSELITIRGETNGTNVSGTVPLDSDLFQSTVNYFRIPKGLTAKIWFKKIAGEGETLFTLQYTYDCTTSPITWKDIQQEKLASKGEISIEKRRPEILRAFTGKEAFRITWTNPTGSPAKAYIEVGVEIE